MRIGICTKKGITTSIFTLFILLFCKLYAQSRYDVIEDFESGQVELLSWLDEDVSPTSWQLTNVNTYNGSAWSLALTGNTWKQQYITPVVVDSGTVFEMAAKTSSGAKIQGIGFSDGINVLFYSIAGLLTLNIEQWIPVYQGAFSNNVWNTYRFPIADDWFSFFDYLPVIESLIYVNDLDGVSARSVWFDSILNVTSDLGVAPSVTITQQQISLQQRGNSTRDVNVQFFASVNDPDSDAFTYAWDFGDGGTSTAANPQHLFTITDGHPYRVFLRVTDDSGKWGLASCLVDIDLGISSLPVKMNFVGDIMLARRYEQAGGIIPTQGVNAIFQPTLHLLGNAADITVANLEVVLTNQGSPHPTKSVVYRGSPSNISGLVYAGIDKVSIANNHTLDYGLAGMNQMRGLLDTNGIIYSGAGADSYEAYSPAFINKSGLNIAFLASSDRTGQYNNAQPYLQAGYNKSGFAYMTPYYISQQLAAVDGVADLKILELHAGSEYSLSPGSNYDKNNPFLDDTQDEDYNYRTDVPHMWDLAIRRYAVEAGADLVIVHHPHIIQGLEVYQGKLIAHSLGNYVFDLDYPECMPTMILYADADHTGFSNYTVKPVYINDYIPVPATGLLGNHILDYLAMRSTDLGTKLMIDYQSNTARVIVDGTDAIGSDHAYMFNMVPEASVAPHILTPPTKLPRYGSISAVNSVSPVQDAEVRFGCETIWYGNFENEGSTLWDVANFSTTDVWDGARSAMLTPTNGQTSTATIKRRSKWYDNTRSYTLHGWIKTRNATNANIVIRYYNTRTGGQIGTEIVTANINGTTDWTWYYKELSIPANAWFYDIRLTCSNSAGGTVQALFDNVGLIEWTPWQAAQGLQNVPNPNNYLWIQARTQEAVKSVNIGFTERRFVPAGSVQTRKQDIPNTLMVYPNPSRDIANIRIDASGKGDVRIGIYNIRGQKVRDLLHGTLPEGKQTVQWDGRSDNGKPAAAGIYFIKVEDAGKTSSGKFVYIRK